MKSKVIKQNKLWKRKLIRFFYKVFRIKTNIYFIWDVKYEPSDITDPKWWESFDIKTFGK